MLLAVFWYILQFCRQPFPRVHEDHPHFPVFVLAFWKCSHPLHQPKILCFFCETFLDSSPSSSISPLSPKLGAISSLFWIPFVLASLMGSIIVYCICLWTHLPAPYHTYGHADVHAKDWEHVLLIFVLCTQNIHSRCSNFLKKLIYQQTVCNAGKFLIQKDF